MGCTPSTPSGGRNSLLASSQKEGTRLSAPDTEELGHRLEKRVAATATNTRDQHVSVLTMKKPELANDKAFRGVSVHYLQNVFLDEVEATAGLGRDSKIYDLENLDGPPGVVRRKGDSAYVHSLQGEDNVGGATHMLSYTWGYKIGDIVDTLVEVCRQQRLDPKRTYFWICFLCVNQHSVVRERKQGKSIPTQQFLDSFERRVSGIGRLVCMMAPWDDPIYLTRCWCIFEVATGFKTEECDVIVAMPPQQKKQIQELLVGDGDLNEGMKVLYEALASTKVQDGKASVEADRLHILDLVKKEGGFFATNVLVNTRLRAWVQSVLEDLVKQEGAKVEAETREGKIQYAFICNQVGFVFSTNGDYDAALLEFHKALEIREEFCGKDHVSTATSYNNIGRALDNKGDYDAALVEYHKALAIEEIVLGKDHPDTAISYYNIGSALDSKGDYDGALVEYRKALAIWEATLGKDHPQSASSYNSIGSALASKGEYDDALAELQKGLTVREAVLGHNHPDTATSYTSIGLALDSKGDYDDALVKYHKALAIQQVTLGNDHPSTAVTYNNIGRAFQYKGGYDSAIVAYRKALDINIRVLGKDHPETAASYNNIGEALYHTGDFDAAFIEYHKALAIWEATLGKDHPSTATCHNNIGSALNGAGDYHAALVEYQQALAIFEVTLGKDHPSTATAYDSIGSALSSKGDYDGALVEYRRALAIREVFDKEHPSTATSYNNIGSALDNKGDFDAALVEYHKALVIQENNKDHPSTATTYGNIGVVLLHKGDYTAALPEFRKAASIHKVTLGKNHPETIMTIEIIRHIERSME